LHISAYSLTNEISADELFLATITSELCFFVKNLPLILKKSFLNQIIDGIIKCWHCLREFKA
jgi:hypothetical protein